MDESLFLINVDSRGSELFTAAATTTTTTATTTTTTTIAITTTTTTTTTLPVLCVSYIDEASRSSYLCLHRDAAQLLCSSFLLFA